VARRISQSGASVMKKYAAEKGNAFLSAAKWEFFYDGVSEDPKNAREPCERPPLDAFATQQNATVKISRVTRCSDC
jgi:hypothetical protein